MSDYSIYSPGCDSATLTYSATADTDYPVTNIQDRNKNTFFKDSAIGANNVYIDFDFGASLTADFIFIGNYIATGANGVRYDLGHDDNDAFSSQDYAVANEVITSATLTNHLKTWSSEGERYWRLLFEDTDGGNLTDLQIGYILIGLKFDFNHNPNFEIGYDSGFSVTVNSSAGGSRYSQVANTTVRRTWDLEYELLQTAEKTNLETFRNNIFMNFNGLSRYPFVFTDDGGTTFYFARARGSLLFTPMAYQLYSTKLRFEEEL